MTIFKKIDWGIEKFATWLLVLCVLSMLTLSSLNIVLRWMQMNITWVDPFVRHVVFLSAFLGGVIATGQGTHIGIDLIGKFVESKGWHSLRQAINQFIFLVSGVVLIWMIKAGIDFTKVELEFGKEDFWGIHSGYLVAMIPAGLSIIALRFFVLFILSFSREGDSK